MTWRGATGIWAAGWAVLFLVSLAGCVDRGFASTEEQMRGLGLPMASLIDLGEGVQATVTTDGGTPELLLFEPYGFGGTRQVTWHADIPTANGGSAGWAYGRRVLFGGGQGKISDASADAAGAQGRIVDASAGTWAVVMPAINPVWPVAWGLKDVDGATLFESVETGMPLGFPVDKETGAAVVLRDGVAELIVFTHNEYGGAAEIVAGTARQTPAGQVGTATAGAWTYVFGASQDDVSRILVNWSDARVSPVTGGSPWFIMAPSSVPTDQIEWRLEDSDHTGLLHGTGGEPFAVFARNDTVEALTVNLDTANGDLMPLVTVPPEQRRMVLGAELRHRENGGGPDGCTTRGLTATSPSGQVVARRDAPLCGATLDTWAIGEPAGSPTATSAGG